MLNDSPLSLKKISEYSPEEVDQAQQAMPIVGRYLQLLKLKPENFSHHLRQQRHAAWVQCALATHFNTSSTKDICLFWSLIADHLIQQAWKESGFDQLDIALLGLGKLGAFELNLSSDIDIMLVSRDTDRSSIVAFRQFHKLLHRVDEFGRVFRVDTDLRPGGKFSPMISSLPQFENHYGHFGETWERLAMVRMRTLAGPKDLADDINQFVKKFSYRRHIDFTLFEDLKTLRPKFHSSFKLGEKTDFHLKLGKGGIRDIELFVHALQIIHGGKHPAVQGLQTEKALNEIKNIQALPPGDCDFLAASYWTLRDFENRAQAASDMQTHSVSLEAEKSVLSQKEIDHLKEITLKTDLLVTSLLGGRIDHQNTLPGPLDEQKQWLQELGFNDRTVNTVWPDLIKQKVRSRRVKTDERNRKKFLQQYVEQVVDIDLDKDLAVALANDFVHAVRAKATFFSFLNHQPDLIRDLAWLFSCSPYLGQILSTRPELLDSFYFRVQEPDPADLEDLLVHLGERRLVAEVIAANDFLSQQNIIVLLFGLSQIADDICQSLLAGLANHLDIEIGRLRILTLGKWAGRELGFRSDLDFIFVSDQEITPKEAKLARHFINKLTATDRGGSIYPIDMRLRPSGKAGPLIVSQSNLQEFIEENAKAWQRQAYSKSRFLRPFAYDCNRAAISKGVDDQELQELRDIREKLRREHATNPQKSLNLKYHAGGLIDIEFSSQIFCMVEKIHSEDVATTAVIDLCGQKNQAWRDNADRLVENYNWLRHLEQLRQLATQQSGSTFEFESSTFSRVSRLLKMQPEQLRKQLTERLQENHNLLQFLDPIYFSR